MKMTKDGCDVILRVHNTLLEVQTFGIHSMKLVDCVRALEQVLSSIELIEDDPISDNGEVKNINRTAK